MSKSKNSARSWRLATSELIADATKSSCDKYYRNFFLTLLIRRAINAVTVIKKSLKHFFRFLAAARSAPPKIGKNATVSFDRCAHWAHRSNGSTTCGWPKKRIAEGEKTKIGKYHDRKVLVTTINRNHSRLKHGLSWSIRGRRKT